MPAFEDHSVQAEHNSDLLAHFKKNDIHQTCCDWYATIAFYSAIHMVEAILAETKKDLKYIRDSKKMTLRVQHSDEAKRRVGAHSEHAFRLTIIRDNPDVFGKMLAPYTNLYENSKKARYECYLSHPDQFNQTDRYLEQVKVEYGVTISALTKP